MKNIIITEKNNEERQHEKIKVIPSNSLMMKIYGTPHFFKSAHIFA